MKMLYACALAGTALLAAGSANATNSQTCTEKRALTFFSTDTAGALWQTDRVDSPNDSNKARIMAHVLHQTQPPVPPYDYINLFTQCTGIKGKTLGQVRNLSFDFMNTSDPVDHPVHVSGGSPRISVDVDSDGDGNADFSAFLAAFHCEAPTSDSLWSRADFTGRTTAGCSIFADAQYTSDGSKSAWTLFAEAHPTWKVTDAYMVFDEDGTSFVDRLAVHNRMWTAGGTSSGVVKVCSTENVC